MVRRPRQHSVEASSWLASSALYLVSSLWLFLTGDSSDLNQVSRHMPSNTISKIHFVKDFCFSRLVNIYFPDCVKGEPGNIMNHEFDNHEISFQEIPVSMLSMELLETTRTRDSLDPGTSVNTPVLDTEDCAVLRYDTRWKVRTTILEKGTTTLVLVYKWSLCSGMQFNILQITFEESGR